MTALANPVEMLVNSLAVRAAKQHARFIVVDRERVRFWIEGEWHVELALDSDTGDYIVRRLGVMIGVLAPAPGQTRYGRIHLTGDSAIYVLVMIDRIDDGTLRAIVELVDESEFASRRAPRTPSEHPYRH